MTRYVVGRAKAAKPLYIETPLWDDAEPMRPILTVDGPEAADTGLITATGEPIFRLPEPMGFHKP
jgi:hypothetical protein